MKLSKTEILHNLADPTRRDATVRWVLKSGSTRIPADKLFGNEKSKWHDFVIENHCTRFYKYFDDLDQRSNSVSLIEHLRSLTIRKARQEIKAAELPQLQAFESIGADIFYHCAIAYKTGDARDEYALLKRVEGCYKRAGRPILRDVFIKFSNQVVNKYLKSSIMDMDTAYAFLCFIATKLNDTVVELWFNEGYRPDRRLFSSLPRMAITADTRFDAGVFEELLRYKPFRKQVFNYWQNEEFLAKMKDYTNRPDYRYYYAQLGLPYEPTVPRPRDYEEYDAFGKFTPSNQSKLRAYQIKHGHNIVMNMYMTEHLEAVLNCADSLDIGLIQETVKYGNDALNLAIWERLKANEALFLSIVQYFERPVEPVLYGLLTGNYDLLTPREAEAYVKFGYENALLDYFRGVPVSELCPLLNSWNQEFFLDVFYQKLLMEKDGGNVGIAEEDTLQLLEQFGKREFQNAKVMARAIDIILEKGSERIYLVLDRRLRFIYAQRNAAVRDTFIREASKAPSLIEKAQLYELGHLAIPKIEPFDIIHSLFELSFILKDESKYYFVEYFDMLASAIDQRVSKEELISIVNAPNNPFIDEPSGYGAERIEFYLRNGTDNLKAPSLEFIMSYLLGLALKNKYTLFILMDSILKIMDGPNTSTKGLLIRFINPGCIAKENVLPFMNALIPQLNSTNSLVCRMAKDCLSQVDIESKEILGIFPDILQALADRRYVGMFFGSFRALLFNNYLCFNSLSLILQILFRYIADHTADVLEILGKLENVVRQRDMERVGAAVFTQLNRFVVSNHYHTEKALKVARIYCFYASYDDYLLLMDHFDVLRVSLYAVGLLKVRSDSELNVRIIKDVLAKSEASRKIPLAFIAAACELNEFSSHFDRFIPSLRELFTSNDQQNRQIAVKSFREVLRTDRTDFSEDTKESVVVFIAECAIYEDYAVRLACLDIIDYLPLLFIMRNDNHILVRKKAYDLWKEHVEHPNKVLKNICSAILNFARFAYVRTFRESLSGTVAELATKYAVHLESFIKSTDENVPSCAEARTEGLAAPSRCNYVDIANKIAHRTHTVPNGGVPSYIMVKEFVLIEAVKANRMVDLALEFTISHHTLSLFHLLYKMPQYQARLMAEIPHNQLVVFCMDAPELALSLYKNTNDTPLIAFLSSNDILQLIADWTPTGDYVEDNTPQCYTNLRLLISEAVPSSDLETAIYKGHPLLSYFYVDYIVNGAVAERPDYGLLPCIFVRATTALRKQPALSLDHLLTSFNLKYFRECPIASVSDHPKLLSLLIEEEDRRSYEMAVQIVLEKGVVETMVYDVAAFLLRNYLKTTRRDQARPAIMWLYANRSASLGYFKTMIENSILNS